MLFSAAVSLDFGQRDEFPAVTAEVPSFAAIP